MPQNTTVPLLLIAGKKPNELKLLSVSAILVKVKEASALIAVIKLKKIATAIAIENCLIFDINNIKVKAVRLLQIMV